jgi:hypothetical protein
MWYDHGIGEGGNIFDLIMRMHNIQDIESVLAHLAGTNIHAKRSDYSSFNSRPVEKEANPAITIQNIIPVTHPKLTAWVQERKIDLDLANLYCREIHYQNQGKNYFSIGFRNDRGGYELSSPPNFKGCISPKDITTICSKSDIYLVFEGFWDFLSYLAIQKIEKTKHDVAILNSVANVQKAMDFLKSHKDVYTYLDNDEAGQQAIRMIKSSCLSVNDRSVQYAGYKDLNDYLCGKKRPQVAKQNKIAKPTLQPPKRKNRGLKM